MITNLAINHSIINQANLTSKETEVTHLITMGLNNKEVASQLFITEGTVKAHLTNIYKKFKISSRVQLITKCLIVS